MRGGRPERLCLYGRAWGEFRNEHDNALAAVHPAARPISFGCSGRRFLRDWEKPFSAILGVTDPADLSPAELAEFTDEVFWRVKQMEIKDPAAWLVTHRARMEASTAPLISGRA